MSKTTVTITSDTNWDIPPGIEEIEILVVAGGGGAGNGLSDSYKSDGGGGGAGGLIFIENYDISGYSSPISVTVGDGGEGSDDLGEKGSTGVNSTFGDLTAIGGGGGGSVNTRPGANGGSGGGASAMRDNVADGGSSTQNTTNDGVEDSGFGNDGADSVTDTSGGGGGADGAGDGTSGGDGKEIFGDTYASGGDAHSDASSGGANTGDGGNASYNDDTKGGDGGSGIVIIKYTAPPTISAQSASNVTDSTARLNYTVDDDGGEEPDVTLYWGKTDEGETEEWDSSQNVGTKAESSHHYDISSLDSGTKYYFKVKGENAGGTDWTDTLSFRTAILETLGYTDSESDVLPLTDRVAFVETLGYADSESDVLSLKDILRTPLIVETCYPKQIGDTLTLMGKVTGEGIIKRGFKVWVDNKVDWYDLDFQYRFAFTVDHTKVEVDEFFPFVIQGSHAPSNFWTNVKSDGLDILVTDASGNKLYRELATFDVATQELELWVNGELSSTVDKTFYVYYGNPLANETNDYETWDSNFVAVYHMNDNPDDSTQILDSTSNENHGQKGAGAAAPTEVDGLIGKAQSFDGTQYVAFDPSESDAWTVEILFNSDLEADFGFWDRGFSGGRYRFRTSHEVRWRDGDNNYNNYPLGNVRDWSGDYFNVATFNGTDTLKGYVNGVNERTNTVAGQSNWTGNLTIGEYVWDGDAFTGKVPETRISNTARGEGWIATTNNSFYATFGTGGDEVIGYYEAGEFLEGVYTKEHPVGKIYIQAMAYNYTWSYGAFLTFSPDDPYVISNGLIVYSQLYLYHYGWHKLPVKWYEILDTATDPVTYLRCEIQELALCDIQKTLLTFMRPLRFQHWIGGEDFGFYGSIIEPPFQKFEGESVLYHISAYDETHDAANRRFIDSYPKTGAETWSEIITDAWTRYGPEVTFDGVETNDTEPEYILSNMGTLQEFMEEVAQRTGWRWKVLKGDLKFYDPHTKINEVELIESDFKPGVSMGEGTPEIANVVYVMAELRVEDFEDEQKTEDGQAQYFLQYPPRRGYGAVEAFFKPRIFVDNNEIDSDDILPDGDFEADDATVVYNLENRFIRFNTGHVPSAVEPLKIIYDARLPVMVERRHASSIDLYGEIHHAIRQDPRPAKDRAIEIGDKYLETHALPITGISGDLNEKRVKCGEYHYVDLDGRRLMPCTETVRGAERDYYLSAMFSKAPVKDDDMIFDLFRRLEKVESRKVSTEERLERFLSVEDRWEWTVEIEAILSAVQYIHETHQLSVLTNYLIEGRPVYPG